MLMQCSMNQMKVIFRLYSHIVFIRNGSLFLEKYIHSPNYPDADYPNNYDQVKFLKNNVYEVKFKKN